MTPLLISSWNGAPATSLAVRLAAQGVPLLAAIVAGIKLVEDDPEEMSVGYGGLPNEDGEVELDAAVMDGPRHKAGGVAGLRRVRHAAAVAYEVLQRTDHALLVGEGALKFARQLGFNEEKLETSRSAEAWLAWKAGLSTRDAWLSPEEGRSEFGRARSAGQIEEEVRLRAERARALPPSSPPTAPFTYGTIHVSGLDARGDLWCATSTSGLSYKIPGRVGDTPIVGAGLYVENDVGSAGATGRGEATVHSCAAFDTVRAMESGMTPKEACLAALRRIVKNTRESRLLVDGRPSFNVTMYALRKDGEVGAASMHEGYQCVVQRGDQTLVEPCAFLFPKSAPA